jgi:hypothetical protein
LAAATMLLGPPAAFADPPDDVEKSGAQWITPPTQRAIDKALIFLGDSQQDDGSFGAGSYRGNVAVTALAGIALVAGGSTPGRGPYGRPLARAVDYLLSKSQPSGLIFAPYAMGHGEQMYSHGFATLFLAECYGMSARPELRERLSRAVKLIENTQNQEGGWRYPPQRVEQADVSVTVCEVMALRSARNAGIFVPRPVIDRSIQYLERCQNADGGFMYQLPRGESALARSAAAVAALYCAGAYDARSVAKGLDYLAGFVPQPGLNQEERYRYYGHYYAGQAMWQAGGKHWSRWYPAVRDHLLSTQHTDGSWRSSSVPPEVDTAMAAVVLQIPNNSLPILQR